MIRDLIQNIRSILSPWNGTISALNAAVRDTVDEGNALCEAEIAWQKAAADAMASTDTAETPLGKVYRDCDILNVDFMPLAALTGDPTNNKVLTVAQRDLNGVNSLTVATLTTTASMVAFKPVALVLSATAANLILAAGSGLTLTITHGGSGVVLPAGILTVRVRLR